MVKLFSTFLIFSIFALGVNAETVHDTVSNLQANKNIVETVRKTTGLLKMFDKALKNKNWSKIVKIDNKLSVYLFQNKEIFNKISDDTTARRLINAGHYWTTICTTSYKYTPTIKDSQAVKIRTPKLKQEDRISYWKSSEDVIIKLRIAGMEFSCQLAELKKNGGSITELKNAYTILYGVYFGLR